MILSRIIARIAEIGRLQADLTVELDELRIAKRVIARFNSTRPQDELRNRRTGTTKALFADVLRTNDEPWMTANEIRKKASVLKGQEIPMATVSPTLTSLKNDGLLVRDGLKVALVERTKRVKAPDADAPGSHDIPQPGNQTGAG